MVYEGRLHKHWYIYINKDLVRHCNKITPTENGLGNIYRVNKLLPLDNLLTLYLSCLFIILLTKNE